jgi:hypothetical protein
MSDEEFYKELENAGFEFDEKWYCTLRNKNVTWHYLVHEKIENKGNKEYTNK